MILHCGIDLLLICVKTLNMKKIYTLVFTSLFLGQSLFAQRLLTEDFNYDAGQLTSADGGSDVGGGNWESFSGGGNFIQVVDGNLTYTDYGTEPSVTSRQVKITSFSGSAEDVSRAFGAVTTNSVYCSFLLNVDSVGNLLADTTNGEYFIAYLPSTSNSLYAARVLIKKGSADNTFNLGISAYSTSSSEAGWSPVNYNINETYLVTFAYEFVTGANNDTAKLWVNTPFFASAPQPLALSVFASGSEPTELGRVAIRQNGVPTPTAKIDAIKVSTGWLDATLPVSLKQFGLQVTNGNVVLNWITANEINMKEYVVERSADGKTFGIAGVVAAKNTVNENRYSYTDAQALKNTSFYRLKMTNKDGSFTYSEILRADAKAIGKLIARTNPVISNLVLSHPQAGENTFIKVYSVNGIMVASFKVDANATQTSVDVSRLVAGNYYALFINGTEKQSLPFIKK